MATPVGFEGANDIFQGYADVRDLQVFIDKGPPAQIISAWRLSKEEIANINETGVIWLSLYATGMPPVYVSGTALVEIEGQPSKAEPIMPWKPAREK